MFELLRIALRVVGVLLPGASLWGIVELRGGVPAGDFGTYLGAMALSLVTAAVWAGLDARRASAGRVVVRWVVTVVLLSVGLSGSLMEPGGNPAEAVSMSLIYLVPLLFVCGLGVVAGAAVRRSAVS